MGEKWAGGRGPSPAGGRIDDAEREVLAPCLRALAQSPDVAWILDYRTGRFSYASPQSERVLGYTPDEVTQLPLDVLLEPESAARVHDLVVSRLCEFGLDSCDDDAEEGSRFTDTIAMKHRDGAMVWVEIAGSLYRDESGDVYAAGIARDVTDRYGEYLSLRDSEERYRTAIQHSVTGLVILSPSGTVMEVSKPFCQMLGCDPANLRNTKFDAAVDSLNAPAFATNFGMVLAGQTDTFRMRIRFQRVCGGYTWGDCSAVAVRRTDGTLRYVIIRVADITAQTSAEEELTRVSKTWAVEKERLRHTLDSVRDSIALLEAVRNDSGAIVDFRILDINKASEATSGVMREQVAGHLVSEVFPAVHHSGIQDNYLRAIETQTPLTISNVKWAVGDVPPSDAKRYDIGIVPYGDTITATWRDITEQYLYAKALAESEERYRLLTANLSGVVVKIRTDDVIDWVSPSLTETTGWRAEDWIGHRVADFFHPEDLEVREEVAEAARSGQARSARWRVADSSGRFHWAQFMARPYLNAEGGREGMVCTFRLVDTEVEYEHELERRARYDDLSGLLNRRSILDKVAGVVGADRRRDGQISAVLFCDIDLLKEVNDTYGHAGGDALIVACAQRMVVAVRESDSVGRIGGDEFLILLDGLHDTEGAMAVAEKVRASVHGEVVLRNGSILFPTLSIGVAIAQPGEGVSALVERANTGLFDAKRGGRDRVVLIPEEGSMGDREPAGGA